MTILQALDGYYARMAARGEAEPPGFSREKISFAIVLSREGDVVQVRDLREQVGKRKLPQSLPVPVLPGKRTVAVVSNLLWDKTAYALGRTGRKEAKAERTASEHAKFQADNLALIGESDDPGLSAFRCFLENWQPDQYETLDHADEMLDANVVFALDGEAHYIHQSPAALRLLDAHAAIEDGHAAQICLVTGIEAPIARLHPSIRGVQGAQTAGAALVSFNLAAFTSYGKEQGGNAPTSEAAAFRYGQALNRMLSGGARNRLSRPVGDATVVFWADASDAQEAEGAEATFGANLDPPEDAEEAAKLRNALVDVAAGRPALLPGGLHVAPGTRFHVLGLAPNAARLSIRYWLTDSFAAFAQRLAAHHDDLGILPVPWKRPPSVRYLLQKTTALQEKAENVPPLLAGEVMRAVLTGALYPRTWLAGVIARLRAGDDPSTGWHAAAIRAVLSREARLQKKEAPPVSLTRESDNPAYQLGRLFAVLESAQRGALGKVNATIRDRYMGAASATPASVFPLLMRGAQNHLGKLRKDGKGGWIEREMEDITDRIEDHFPRSLKLEQQGRFFLGYYHQRKAQFEKAKAAGEAHEHDDDANGSSDDDSN